MTPIKHILEVTPTAPKGSIRLVVENQYRETLDAFLEGAGIRADIRDNLDPNRPDSCTTMLFHKEDIAALFKAGVQLPEEAFKHHAPFDIKFFIPSAYINQDQQDKPLCVWINTAALDTANVFLDRIAVSEREPSSSAHDRLCLTFEEDDIRRLHKAGVKLPEGVLQAVGIETENMGQKR